MGNPGSGRSVCDRVDRGIRGPSGGKSSGIVNADKHSPVSNVRGTKQWVRGTFMSVRTFRSH